MCNTEVGGRPALLPGLIGLLAVAAFVFAPVERTARASAPVCPAARVHHEPNARLGTLDGGAWVAPTPRAAGLFGSLFGGREVDGRFSVYAGGRNPINGASEKVLWILASGAPGGGRLTIAGRRLRVTASGRVRVTRGAFRHVAWEASSDQTPGRLFPSILDVPRPGCWRLTLRTGPVSARMIVTVQPSAGR